jgi:hypothetical protein
MMQRMLVLVTLASATVLSAQQPSRSTAEQVGDTAGRVVTQPLQDLNVSGNNIPPELQAIIDRPYDISMLRTCADKRKAVAELTKVLGPDIDSPQATARGQSPSEFALGAAESAATSLIPGRSLIRKVSGADAAERRLRAAILAGQLRRAYIRGNARGTNCQIG